MLALVTNDDGIEAPGIRRLAAAAVAAGLDVVVAAPHVEQSGASAAMQAVIEDGRIRIHETSLDRLDGVRAVGVEATPAFVVRLAAQGAFGDRPDLVLSGINPGINAGHDVVHSGTVGAALTASLHDIPGLAFSLQVGEGSARWDTAEDVAERVLRWFLARSRTPSPTCLSINIPDVPVGETTGIVEAPLATGGVVQARVVEVDEGAVRLPLVDIDTSSEPDCDIARVRGGWVTVTALSPPHATDSVDLGDLLA